MKKWRNREKKFQPRRNIGNLPNGDRKTEGLSNFTEVTKEMSKSIRSIASFSYPALMSPRFGQDIIKLTAPAMVHGAGLPQEVT